MFAEDVEAAARWQLSGPAAKVPCEQPAVLQKCSPSSGPISTQGGFSAALAQDVLHFNGKLFKGAGADRYSLLASPPRKSTC